VERSATTQEIKTAYRRKALDTHPDKNRHMPQEQAAESFRQVVHAFEILSDEKIGVNANIRCQLINQIAKSIGFNGMAGGQMMDLEAENQTLSKEQIFKLHNLKTGKMFTSAVLCGAILGNADKKSIDFLAKYSADIGLAFQIKDDILDFEENKLIPKSKPDQASIVNLIGLENSVSKLEELKISAKNHLKEFDDKADLLRDIVDFIVTRKN
jgi:farnesyl diphosphate synthase